MSKMKRDITFRGRLVRADGLVDGRTDGWVYGMPHRWTGVEGRMAVSLVCPRTWEEFLLHEVDPATVGQYTGLADCKGRRVYEDDIICIPPSSYNGETKAVVVFDKGTFAAQNVTTGGKSDLAWALRRKFEGEPLAYVIGNCYENPELLEGNRKKKKLQ